MKETKNCIYCFAPATVWSGHVLHKGEKVFAGWCEKCRDNPMKLAGFLGHYKKKYGKLEIGML